MIPKETICDCCDNLATVELTSKTCKYIADWFKGWYCKKCSVAVSYFARECYFMESK